LFDVVLGIHGGVQLRRILGAAGSAALISALLPGCTQGSDDRATPVAKASSGASWNDDLKPAPGVGKLGAAGTPCALPVSFELAQSWKAKPVADDAADFPLGQQGGLALKCEVDAKPAGHLGFLRVWAGGKAGEHEDGGTVFKRLSDVDEYWENGLK
jgi:hypothetical protein